MGECVILFICLSWWDEWLKMWLINLKIIISGVKLIKNYGNMVVIMLIEIEICIIFKEVELILNGR